MKKFVAVTLFLLMTGSTLILTASTASSQIPLGYINLMQQQRQAELYEKEADRLYRQTPKNTQTPKKNQTRNWKKSQNHSKNK